MVEEFPANPRPLDQSPTAKPNRRLVLYPAILVFLLTLANLILLGVQLYDRDDKYRSIEYARAQFVQDELGLAFWVLGLLVCLIWVLIVFRLVWGSGRSIAFVRQDQTPGPRWRGLKLALTAILFSALSLTVVVGLVYWSITLIAR